MKKVTIIGAGMMTGPIADYLMDTCNYQVIMADRIISKAQKIIRERPLGKAVELSVQDANVKNGTNLDVLLEGMLKKMSYKPHEKDMIIVHIEALAEFPGKTMEKRTATMHFKGIPYGASAMSRAVGLPMAVGARLVLEGKIKAAGAHIPPTLPVLYRPVLHELANFGFRFHKKTWKNKLGA